MPSGNLYIVNVTYDDAGIYECFATNPVSNARRRSDEANLTVVGMWSEMHAGGSCVWGNKNSFIDNWNITMMTMESLPVCVYISVSKH